MPPHGRPQASARSIKGRQRRHWRPLAATLLKSLPACILSVISQDLFFWSFVDFCGRRKLFLGYLGACQPARHNCLPHLDMYCISTLSSVGMYWGYTESLLVWLLYSFISNMVTYQDILEVTPKQVLMLIQRLGVLLVSCRVWDPSEIPFSISLSFWQPGSRRPFWQILDGSFSVANIAEIFGAFEILNTEKTGSIYKRIRQRYISGPLSCGERL